MAADEHVPEELEDLVALLEGCPAFAGVPSEALSKLAARAEIAYIAAGDPVPPDAAQRPVVVERGALLVFDAAGRTVDLVGEREFHAPATGERAEAVEAVLAVLLPDEAIDAAWSAPPPRLRARRAGTVIDEQTAAVRTIMSAPPITASADESCREVAARMKEHRISSVIVHRGAGESGILTDRDLRQLVASGGPIDAPVGAIASFPVRGVSGSTPVFEALIEMLTNGIHHLAVFDAGVLVGVVTSTDLLQLRTRSPLHLRKAIDLAHDVEGLASALAELPETAAALLAAGTTATDVGRVVAAISDRVDGRLLALATETLGPAPATFGWIAFGSQARQEQTLHSDQDTGLIFPDGLGSEQLSWFAALGRWMTDALERCGYPRCPGGVMASEPAWRRDESGWRGQFEAWMATPVAEHLIGAEIAFDHRTAAGEVDAARSLRSTIAGARSRQLFLAYLAREAVAHRPPLGFLGGLAVERAGAHVGTFDVKRGALLPIADLARVHTLARGGTEVSTDERLAASAASGAVSADLGETLRAGYELALRLRFEHHLRQRAEGAPLDNHIDPNDLPVLDRSRLREVFKATRKGQEVLQDVYGTARL